MPYVMSNDGGNDWLAVKAKRSKKQKMREGQQIVLSYGVAVSFYENRAEKLQHSEIVKTKRVRLSIKLPLHPNRIQKR